MLAKVCLARRGAGFCCSTPLRRRGEADAVVSHVKDGVILLEEDVPQDPERLPILGRQVGGLNPNSAVTVVL